MSRSWAKLRTDWHEDDDLQTLAAEHGTRIMSYFAVMIAECKRRMPTKDGWWSVDHASFACAAGDVRSRKRDRVAALEAMKSAGLIDIVGDPARRFQCRPTALLEHQVNTTSTPRVQKHRTAKAADTRSQAENTANETFQKRVKRPETETETETETQTEIAPVVPTDETPYQRAAGTVTDALRQQHLAAKWADDMKYHHASRAHVPIDTYLDAAVDMSNRIAAGKTIRTGGEWSYFTGVWERYRDRAAHQKQDAPADDLSDFDGISRKVGA